MLVHHSRLPAWPRSTSDDPYFGPYKSLSVDGQTGYYTLLSVTYNTLSANTLEDQLPLSSKQALRDSSGSLKERTKEPLGSLNKVYRAQFAWPTL